MTTDKKPNLEIRLSTLKATAGGVAPTGFPLQFGLSTDEHLHLLTHPAPGEKPGSKAMVVATITGH